MLIDQIDSNLGDITKMKKDRNLDIHNSPYSQFLYIKIISFPNFKKAQTLTMHKLPSHSSWARLFYRCRYTINMIIVK